MGADEAELTGGLPTVRRMPGPVRPQWGELDAVLREVLGSGGSREELLVAAEEVAFEEDLDLDRAAARADALWAEVGGARAGSSGVDSDGAEWGAEAPGA